MQRLILACPNCCRCSGYGSTSRRSMRQRRQGSQMLLAQHQSWPQPPQKLLLPIRCAPLLPHTHPAAPGPLILKPESLLLLHWLLLYLCVCQQMQHCCDGDHWRVHLTGDPEGKLCFHCSPQTSICSLPAGKSCSTTHNMFNNSLAPKLLTSKSLHGCMVVSQHQH